MTIGERIKKKRKELGWSQRELSSRMGYQNHSTITKIEAGKVDLPQTRLSQFASVLGTSVAYLMGIDEEMQKKNDILADITLKMMEDAELLEIAEALSELGFEKRQAVKSVIDALSTVEG